MSIREMGFNPKPRKGRGKPWTARAGINEAVERLGDKWGVKPAEWNDAPKKKVPSKKKVTKRARKTVKRNG